MKTALVWINDSSGDAVTFFQHNEEWVAMHGDEAFVFDEFETSFDVAKKAAVELECNVGPMLVDGGVL